MYLHINGPRRWLINNTYEVERNFKWYVSLYPMFISRLKNLLWTVGKQSNRWSYHGLSNAGKCLFLSIFYTMHCTRFNEKNIIHIHLDSVFLWKEVLSGRSWYCQRWNSLTVISGIMGFTYLFYSRIFWSTRLVWAMNLFSIISNDCFH